MVSNASRRCAKLRFLPDSSLLCSSLCTGGSVSDYAVTWIAEVHSFELVLYACFDDVLFLRELLQTKVLKISAREDAC